MFRNKLKAIFCLALVLLLAALPAAAETGVEERLSDLETLRAGLEEGHYDLFALVTPEEWEARVEKAAETLRDEDTDDITACYALIELVASLGDAHTQAWFSGGNAQGTLRALPLQTGLFSGRVYLLATTEPYADYLGMEITAIAGVPMAEAVSYTHLDVYKRQRQFLPPDRRFIEGDGAHVVADLHQRAAGAQETHGGVVGPVAAHAVVDAVEAAEEVAVAAHAGVDGAAAGGLGRGFVDLAGEHMVRAQLFGELLPRGDALQHPDFAVRLDDLDGLHHAQALSLIHISAHAPDGSRDAK